MERRGGSGERSRITEKTPQSSSSCLSFKEKSNGVGRKKQNFQKKRSRVIVSDSESSDEFMIPPRGSVDRKNLGAKGSSEKKLSRSKLDVFEFDEYDGFDNANLMKKRFDNGNVFVRGRSSFAPKKVDMSSQEKLSSESDPDVPIKLQGRNGVLKAKLYNKTSALPASNNHQKAELYETPSSRKVQKRENAVVKPTFRKSNNVDYKSESDDSNGSGKWKRTKPERGISKREINTKSQSSFTEPVKPAAREERRERRGGGTEKQKLRDKIKGMLIDAGWTVDYRPRRNQSYRDAVYVNPSGTAYWSIIKAYDALLKQLKDEEINARSRKDAATVASVSEDIVNNLARKVKKTRTEMTKKWNKDSSGSDSEREDGDGGADSDIREKRMGSFVNLAGKSKKRGKTVADWDDLHSKGKRLSYYDARPSSGSDSHNLHGRESKKIGRCTLKVRSSEDKKNPETDGFNPYSVKRTLLSWLIECGVVKLKQKVRYMNRQCTKVMMEGWITGAGIHCVCCSKILTLSRFEIHAGSKSCQPFQNIYLESGSSLLKCQIRAWNMQKDAKNLGFHHVDTDDPNDDTCGICGDGGDLICCDGCPSTYHQTCLGMEVLPVGDWHCPNCTCKFCDSAVDSGGQDGNHLLLLSCNMCERRYHQSCISGLEAHKVQAFGSASSFCGHKCFELFEKLQKYLGVKNEIEGGYSWSLIHRVDKDSNSNSNSQLSAQRVENNSKLAVGLAIMDECFLPIIDRRSGVNLIRNVLYNCGSNFNRINYTGFYTAVLERGDEIISVASLRFHGMQLAEMPFIGTRHIYRRQGMCRRLFDAIESALRSLKVENLVIPAIPDFLHAWTRNFGFSPLDDSIWKEMRSLNTLVFPGIDVLQKPLICEENVIASAAAGDYDVVHEDAMNSEIKTESISEFTSSSVIGRHCNEFVADGADCYKNIIVSDEDNIPLSVETAMDTISRPEDDELRRSIPGEGCGISSSSHITFKSGTKQCEDTGSSCEDVNVEGVASLVSQEILQASADFQVENNLSSSFAGTGSSDMSSISQEAKSEQNSSNGDAVLSCKDSDILGPGDNAFADGFLLRG